MFINFTMNHTVAIIAKLPLTKLKIVPMILVLNCSNETKRTEIFKCVYYFRLLHKHKIEATGFIPQINQWVFALRFYKRICLLLCCRGNLYEIWQVKAESQKVPRQY